MCLVATEWDSIHVQHFQHHSNFYWKPKHIILYTVGFQRFECPFGTLPTLIPRCTWMHCLFQYSESPSKVHLNRRKVLTESHEDHQVLFPYTWCFGQFWMAIQGNFYMVPQIPKAQPLPLQSSSSPWILSMDGTWHPCMDREVEDGKGGKRNGMVVLLPWRISMSFLIPQM